MIKSRISILDSFRALAILAVMLFHFFSRWTPPLSPVSLYPYKSDYDYFSWGKSGVQFFFIISGFVIFFTLENTAHFHSFWKKRLIRLLPSIMIASIITYTVFNIFDTGNLFPYSHTISSFIPSLTFIHPNIFNYILSNESIKLNYINWSYWSLWPEIQFYLFSSLLYYLNKDKFLRNFMLASISLVTINYIIQSVQAGNKMNIYMPPTFLVYYFKWIQNGFNLLTYLPFFSLGVLFYSLFKHKKNSDKVPIWTSVYLAFFILFIFFTGPQPYIKVIYIIMFVLFFLFIYLPDSLAFLENKTLTDIGQSSYFLYLIHENIGVLLIYSLGSYFSSLSVIFTLLIMVLLIALSNVYTFKIDKKINSWLKKSKA